MKKYWKVWEAPCGLWTCVCTGPVLRCWLGTDRRPVRPPEQYSDAYCPGYQPDSADYLFPVRGSTAAQFSCSVHLRHHHDDFLVHLHEYGIKRAPD